MGFGAKKSMSVTSSVETSHPIPGMHPSCRDLPNVPNVSGTSVCRLLKKKETTMACRSLDNTTVSTITSHKAGYIDKDNELIVGLQTDELLKRSIKPFGGINVVAKACRENGVEVDDRVKDIFTHYRKTHNDGVFDVYTEEIRSFRSLGFLTGLPRQLCSRTYHR